MVRRGRIINYTIASNELTDVGYLTSLQRRVEYVNYIIIEQMLNPSASIDFPDSVSLGPCTTTKVLQLAGDPLTREEHSRKIQKQFVFDL